VALLHARFGVAIFLARRTPLAGFRTASSDKPRVIRIIKVFSFYNVLHFTSHFRFARFCGVKCKVYMQFTLALPQTAAAKFITQALGGYPRG